MATRAGEPSEVPVAGAGPSGNASGAAGLRAVDQSLPAGRHRHTRLIGCHSCRVACQHHARLVDMGYSLTTLKVLRQFLYDPSAPQYGLELSAACGVKAGALYPILARLEDDGWLEAEWEDINEALEGRRRRRYYRLAAFREVEARELLAAAAASLAPPGATRANPRRRWAPT
jgi:PadR family transcriptional regulator, regulatory protein PadR